MFVLAKETVWTWPVKVQVPTDGGFVAQAFRARWRLVEKAQRDDLAKTEAGLDALLRLSVVEILDVQDEAGQAVAHTPALLEALIGVPWVRHGLVMAMVEAFAGRPSAAAAGN